MDTTTETDRGEVRAAAATAMAPDPLTASLLAKHAAFKEGDGPRPTQSEFGKLGAWIKRKFTANADAAPAGHVPQENGGPVETPGDDLDGGPIDAGLVQRTTAAVLSRLENIARQYVGKAAKQAGAEGALLARFDRAASIPKDDRALMVELSPEVAASLGMNPRHYPVAVFVGCLGLWATDLFLAVQELKAMELERQPKPVSPEPKKTQGASPGVVMLEGGGVA